MSTLGKVILAIVIVAVGSVAILAVGGVIFARHVRVQESGNSAHPTVDIDTPFGKVKVQGNKTLNPELVGIPIYPGATLTDDKGGAAFQFDAGDVHKDFTVAGAKYVTDDPPEKVRDFYSQKFPNWKSEWKDGNFHFEMKEDGVIRSVSVERKNDHTVIGVASVGPPAAN